MLKSKATIFLFFTGLSAVFIYLDIACAGTPASEYLCSLGVAYYRIGRYDDALIEFSKTLLIAPDNETAKKYINEIIQKNNPSVPALEEKPTEDARNIPEAAVPEAGAIEPGKNLSREDAISNALNKAAKDESSKPKAGIKVTGEGQLRLGIAQTDAIWNRANFDLNEKNFRMLSTNAFDRKENTYDPRIYDRLKINLDAAEKEGFGFHTNITADPWSYTGKSNKFTVTSAYGDQANIQLKYWGNTGYTLNETVNTLKLGNSFALSELQVHGNTVDAFRVSGAFNPYPDTFIIPQTKITREFQPVRELWVDYKNDYTKLRVFPMAYENQALTFDDPLKLSNNRTWWEDSPWLRRWTHGIRNTGATPVDFTKGFWDKSDSFTIRDSEGQRLTALRGFSFNFSPSEETSITSGFATPKDLWQDYSDVDNIISATRAKQFLRDNLMIGGTYTTRLGFNVDKNRATDVKNQVASADLSYEITNGLVTNLEVARSESYYDVTDNQFNTKARGNAYYVSLVERYPQKSIIDTAYGYNGIGQEKDERFFTKIRIFAARLDDSFDQPLSSYVQTRNDEFWGRHLHFRKPFRDYYQGEGQTLSWDDIKDYKIGTGIDVGRSTLGMRMESSLWDKKVDNLFDVRNVRTTEGKFVENVARDELTWQVTDKLTSKALGIDQKMPRTKKGIDPFIFDTTTRRYFDNSYIDDGQDPSVRTGSFGLEYAFFDWLALNGIWEYTNDISVGYDNFPRGIFNNGERSFTFYEDYNVYRDVRDSLYDQQFFPKPPYPYYNIFKSGLRLTPIKELEFYLDYTRNSYEKAGQTDDNMNHVGFEVGYAPNQKIAIFLKYTYSRWQDLDLLTSGSTKLAEHHNIFTEFIYRISKDEDFTLQYGEASRDPYMGGVLAIGWDPYGGSLRTIDTQHIVRLFYRRKF